MNRIWMLSLLIVGIIIADQLSKGAVQSNFHIGESKVVIDGFFNFTYITNKGAAFGFLSDASDSIRKPLFLFIPVIACIWLGWLIWASRKQALIAGLAYSLILSGAIGNLIDRFSLGYVVDFLDFYYKANHFPAFNIADSAITIAAFLLGIDFIQQIIKNRKPQEHI
ncbi:MAG: signal peptidase II [Bacteriovoracaceae bacterium]|jgi:signal peptidase II|nr:signal peptidase II [Bacteriovoracaceae bacterium]